MNAPQITALELIAIEDVLQMGRGYVLDFGDRTFAAVFEEHGVQIDDPRYSTEGTSKAKRLRCFLRNSSPPRSGRVLGTLLEHRLARQPDGIAPATLDAYRRAVERLGGPSSRSADASRSPSAESAESALLRRAFQSEMFDRLPIDSMLRGALVGRMREAHACIESKAYLASVILCGSVLEGVCLGFGCQHPARVNRAYCEQYAKIAPQFHLWRLRDWIDVLGRLGDLSPNIGKFGHALRDFRNYVHPAEQLAHRFSPDQHTARISFHVVVAAAEDLVRAETRLTREAAP